MVLNPPWCSTLTQMPTGVFPAKLTVPPEEANTSLPLGMAISIPAWPPAPYLPVAGVKKRATSPFPGHAKVGATPPAAMAGGDSGWKEITRRVKRGIRREGRADARLVKGAFPSLQPTGGRRRAEPARKARRIHGQTSVFWASGLPLVAAGLSGRLSFQVRNNSIDLQREGRRVVQAAAVIDLQHHAEAGGNDGGVVNVLGPGPLDDCAVAAVPDVAHDIAVGIK